MSERARHFPERGAVKPRPRQCNAASVCCNGRAGERCIAHALERGEWCWSHQKRIDEGARVVRWSGVL
jgi:hypothetical protein